MCHHLPMIERYSFVAVTTRDLSGARTFWVDQLQFPVTEEKPNRFFIVDAGGLRLCVDLEDEAGGVHIAGGTDPVIGFHVTSLTRAVSLLRDRGLHVVERPADAEERGPWAEVRDPDGRTIVFTETD